MIRKYNYFYKITNLINNHFYYGVHSTDNIDDGYMGSGHRLHRAYKKYGQNNFIKEIIKFFDTREEALDYEESIVNENLIKDNKCYNEVIGGGGIRTIGLFPVRNIITGEQIMMTKDDPRYISGELKSYNKGQILCIDNNGNSKMLYKDDPLIISGEYIPFHKGRQHSEEHKRKLSEARKKNSNIKEKQSGWNTKWMSNDK